MSPGVLTHPRQQCTHNISASFSFNNNLRKSSRRSLHGDVIVGTSFHFCKSHSWRVVFEAAHQRRGWFYGSLSLSAEKKVAAVGVSRIFPVVNSVTDWSHGSFVKVVGFGTRASSAIQFCHESELLSPAELWISQGEGVNMQSLVLLDMTSVKMLNGQEGPKGPKIVVLVLGTGATSLCGKEAFDILQSSRGHDSVSVMIVIQPFNFEGAKRKKEIEVLAGSLIEHVDLFLVLNHDALFRKEKVTLTEALKLADNTVLYAIKAVSDLVMSDQVKLFDAPPEGLRDISNAQIVSMLEHARNTGVGFGSSYSIKNAIQRAIFESPFLQGLIPGLKGLVVCIIACAEEKGRKDLVAAVHTLRCAIGPRAQLICVSVTDLSLKRGEVLVTILLTRTENGGSQDVSDQYTSTQELSPPSGLIGSIGYSMRMNGRELRKTTSESPVESMENLSNLSKLQEQNHKSLSSSIDSFETDQSTMVQPSDPPVFKKNVNGSSTVSIDCQSTTGEEAFEAKKMATTVATAECGQTDVNEDPVIDSGSIGNLLRFAPGTPESSGEMSPNNSLAVSDMAALEISQPNSGSVEVQGDATVPEKQPPPLSYEDKSELVEKDDNGRWKFPSFSSLINRGRENWNEKGNIFGWESGPNSATAEAWAQTRQQLGNLGTLKLYNKLPVGVKPSSGLEKEVFTWGWEQGKEGDPSNSQLLFSFDLPLGRILSSGWEAVADMYNAATARIFKVESEEGKKASSSLSQRAASMLESERSSMKLPPMVEMHYKNGVYKGRCMGGLPEGKGRLMYKDGSFYDGLWKQGKRAGSGSFYYANGDVFQGFWRDDQKHGKGWFYFHTGDRLYADFWKGKANGEGRYYSAKGDVFFGYFRENWRHGDALSIEGGARWCEIWDHGVLISRTRVYKHEQN